MKLFSWKPEMTLSDLNDLRSGFKNSTMPSTVVEIKIIDILKPEMTPKWPLTTKIKISCIRYCIYESYVIYFYILRLKFLNIFLKISFCWKWPFNGLWPQNIFLLSNRKWPLIDLWPLTPCSYETRPKKSSKNILWKSA